MPEAVAEQGLIERYLPSYTFSHRYETVVDNAHLETVFEVARDVDLGRSPVVAWLFRLRGLPTAQLRARAFTRAMGWTDLEERAPHEFLIGYWRSQRIERVSDPAAFAGELPGARQKVAFSFRFVPIGGGRTRILTETRVQCLTAAERRAFRLYWVLIRPFSGLVRKEVLRLIKQEAEAKAAAPQWPAYAMVFTVPAPILWGMRLYYQVLGRIAPNRAAQAFKHMMTGMPRRPLSARDRDFLATGRRLDLACDDITLVAHEWGQGPTVLLMHGLLGSAANFHAMVPTLVQRGLRVVALDSPNHGLSPNGPTFSAATLRQMRQALQQIGPLQGMVCHSAGAYLAMLAMLELPQGVSVQRCVYIAPYPSIEVTLRTFMSYFRVPENVFHELGRWIGELAGVPYQHQSLVECLPRHRTPGPPQVMFVHDADDVHIPLASTQQVASRLGGLPIHVTSGLGHFKVLRDPQVAARVADFLLADCEA